MKSIQPAESETRGVGFAVGRDGVAVPLNVPIGKSCWDERTRWVLLAIVIGVVR